MVSFQFILLELLIMSLHRDLPFYLLCFSTANTAPVITKFLYEVCEDTPPGT